MLLSSEQLGHLQAFPLPWAEGLAGTAWRQTYAWTALSPSVALPANSGWTLSWPSRTLGVLCRRAKCVGAEG